ncbi:hypothetical protein BHE90_005758 [Fusarium euwallaceae]|uniref:Uncharacterized protein n=1 Tax=Fusarium euwallaceae TaxID=1147111 RepID=A0A430LVI0_9HYPO|nr:hypothetical protein BHE90_005758 [Fusarium euwallaceae]
MSKLETEVYGEHLLHEALHILGKLEVLQSAQDKRVILSKFPKQPQTEISPSGEEREWATFSGVFATGVSGKSTTHAQGTVTDGITGVKSTISIAPGDYWEIRFDYDTAKGSHVNVKVGGKGEHKFAVMLPPEDHRRHFDVAANYYLDAIRDQSATIGFYQGMQESGLLYCAEELVEVFRLKNKEACSNLGCGSSL